MNDYVVRGSNTWTQNSIESTSDPRNGDTTTVTGTAMTQADASAKATYYRNLGWSVSIKQRGAGDTWTVTATYNSDVITDPTEVRIPDTQWEVLSSDFQSNILESTDRAFIKDLSTQTKTRIEAAIKLGLPQDNVPQLTTVADVAQLPNALALYNLMRIGVDCRQNFTTLLKRTVTVSTRFNISWSLTNNDKVLSKSNLANSYLVPLWVQRLMPESSYDIETDINGVARFWGYLEYQPSYQSVSGNRVQISQEWVYNNWSAGAKGLYDVVY
jgi:hypothetical protein